MKVHIGPRDAGDAVKPKAGDRENVTLDREEEIVLVGHVVVVKAQEKLREGLYLSEGMKTLSKA